MHIVLTNNISIVFLCILLKSNSISWISILWSNTTSDTSSRVGEGVDAPPTSTFHLHLAGLSLFLCHFYFICKLWEHSFLFSLFTLLKVAKLYPHHHYYTKIYLAREFLFKKRPFSLTNATFFLFSVHLPQHSTTYFTAIEGLAQRSNYSILCIPEALYFNQSTLHVYLNK